MLYNYIYYIKYVFIRKPSIKQNITPNFVFMLDSGLNLFRNMIYKNCI